MNISGEARILKDDRGIYKTTLATKVIDENGEEKTIFTKVNVGFKKGVELKNKTKINIKDGFLTFFRIPTEETRENGTTINKDFLKIVVMDFEVLEDGVDEVYSSKPKKTVESDSSDNEMGEFYPDTYSDDFSDLPF